MENRWTAVELAAVQRAYRRYSRHYDRLFGRVFDAGRRRAVAHASTPPRTRILEVGVGTGLSLPYYPPTCRVVGVDVSADMLEIARRRAADERLGHVEALLQMDAENLDIPDASFDAVVAMYVATVVPDPGRLLAEMARVCVPGGELLLVSHFASEHPVLRAAESAFSPLASVLGFRPSLPLEAVPEPAGVERVAVEPVNALGFCKVVRYRRTATTRVSSASPLDSRAGARRNGAARLAHDGAPDAALAPRS